MRGERASVSCWFICPWAIRNSWPERRRRWLTMIIVLFVGLRTGNAFAAAPDLSADLSHYVVSYGGTHGAIEGIGPLGAGVAGGVWKECGKAPAVTWVH